MSEPHTGMVAASLLRGPGMLREDWHQTDVHGTRIRVRGRCDARHRVVAGDRSRVPGRNGQRRHHLHARR